MSRLANVLIAAAAAPWLDELLAQLKERNFSAKTCGNAAETLEHARTSQPDVAVVGLASPDFDGFQLAADLGEHVPVVPVATGRQPELFARALQAGAADLFFCPLDYDEFFTRLRSLLRLSTMVAEVHRRTKLAGRFGVKVEDHIDLKPSDNPYNIFVAGADGEEEKLIGTMFEGNSLITAHPDLLAAEKTLTESFYDASVIALDEDIDREPMLEMCLQLRKNPRLYNLPMIFLAPPVALPDRTALYGHGATVVIDRPPPPAQLRFVLASQINSHRRRWQIRQAMDMTLRQPIVDALTGGYTFEFMRAHLRSLIKSSRAWRKHLTLVFFSIPDVIGIRRQFGDEAADDLVQQLFRWISGMLRTEDMTALYKEHDFCVALPDTPLDEADLVMHRIAGVISYTDFALCEVYQPIIINVEVSMAELETNDSVDSLIARARIRLD
ncbi:MAG: diguanylate cyclase [Rhodospirillales bacterium]|jgi:two-component system cell cycle response regulator|nr:diguanylate cyclase [Rhodospirillales bacterium]HIJ44106.1 diguanylate cyclase [Rhodospirillaceae bacterium]MDP7097810.1 diguanylate cyclase [Rhodospirillales bacterium]MDP7216400.1 diguanylate cyclase [Rhodospirillales bacterium]HIJ46058.1 diguanylate cyclase [Rhodospirillaceae bacterium]